MKVPFSPPDISEKEVQAVVDTLRSGWITTGPKTKLFEKKIAEFCGTKKTVCLNSSTSSMELTLRLLGIKEGDEVITTAYTYTATASVICHVGAKLVLVDTKKNSYEMDYDKLSEAINEKTKVIIPVDLAGVMCNYNKIFEIVNEKKHLFEASNDIQKAFNRIIVMSDAAHAFGAKYNNKMCGSVADFTTFSFHAVKNLTTAEGGAVTWKDIKGIDNEDIYKKYMLLSLHGQSKDALSKTKLGSWEYDIELAGYKCNMTDIMASIGLVQLSRYEGLLKRRKEIIEMYNEGLKELDISVLNHYTDQYLSSGHLYLVRLNGKDIDYRNKVIEEMAQVEIATNVHYKPLPMLTAYKNIGFNINDYENAYNMFKNEITLPLNTCMTNEQVNYVIDNFKRILLKDDKK